MRSFFFKQKAWLWPILLFALLTPFSAQLDLAVSRYFYQGNGAFSPHPVYLWMFKYGIIPAQLTCAVAVIVWLTSFIWSSLQKWRRPALVLILTLGIGSGLITHALLKDHWGRPRPKQVVEFDGQQAFRPYYSPNFFHQPEPSKSFVCGHCTMGFFFFALALVAKRKGYEKLFVLSLVLAFGLGIFLSFIRIAQGGHFLFDTLGAALVMWLTSYACVAWLLPKTQSFERQV